MNPIENLPITGLNFLFLLIAFIPMEKVFPAKAGQKIAEIDPPLRTEYFLSCFGGEYLFHRNKSDEQEKEIQAGDG